MRERESVGKKLIKLVLMMMMKHKKRNISKQEKGEACSKGDRQTDRQADT